MITCRIFTQVNNQIRVGIFRKVNKPLIQYLITKFGVQSSNLEGIKFGQLWSNLNLKWFKKSLYWQC
jgi:hypothetical protein